MIEKAPRWALVAAVVLLTTVAGWLFNRTVGELDKKTEKCEERIGVLERDVWTSRR